MQETWVRSLSREDPLEEGMATHSSILAWRIPQTEEPGGQQFTGSQGGGHNWGTLTHIHARKRPCKVWATNLSRLVLHALTFVLCTPFTKAFLWIEKQSSFSCPSFWRLLPCLYDIPLAGCIFLNLQISFQMSLPPGELSWLGQALGLSFLVLFPPHQSLQFSDSRNNMYFTYILRTWQQCPAYNSASAKQTFSSQSPGYLSVPGPASECLTFSFTGRTRWALPGFSLARETKQVTVP